LIFQSLAALKNSRVGNAPLESQNPIVALEGIAHPTDLKEARDRLWNQFRFVGELMRLRNNKLPFFQKSMRARNLILSTL